MEKIITYDSTESEKILILIKNHLKLHPKMHPNIRALKHAKFHLKKCPKLHSKN